MASYNDILKQISKAIEQFNGKIPAIQKDVLDGIQEDLRGLDLNNGKIKATVKNLSRINSIKNRLRKIILTDNYKADVKQFAQSFNEITKLQNEFWKAAEKDFSPRPLLREIKNQAIEDTVTKLMDSGIDANIGDKITDILRQNITSGGSYKSLSDQLREFLTKTDTPGGLEKYAKQITTDAMNQYNAQYTQVVSSDLGFEWFKYDNTDIDTTRPFCDAMTDIQYFHVSQVPAFLRAEGLTYVNKKGQRVPVPIYEKTGLPHGMIPGTDPSNFFVRRGGYNCGHQIRPVSEALVQKVAPEAVFKVKQPMEKGFATTKQQKFNVALAAGNKENSLDFYRDADGNITKDRQKLHSDIQREYLADGSVNEGTIFIMGGAPASGKSVLIKSGQLPHPEKILVVDSDRIKGMIPEYNQMIKDENGEASYFVHEESSVLSKQIISKSLEKDWDVVIDGVADGKFSDFSAKIARYRELSGGKRLRADYVTCDTELSLDREAARGGRTGRRVPKAYMLEMNEEISRLVPQLIRAKSFDELYLWDTNESGAPRLVLSQINGKLKIYNQTLYERFLKKGK